MSAAVCGDKSDGVLISALRAACKLYLAILSNSAKQSESSDRVYFAHRVRKTGGSVAQRQFCRCRQNCRCLRSFSFSIALVLAMRPTVTTTFWFHYATSTLFRDGDKAFWAFHFWFCRLYACHVSLLVCLRCCSKQAVVYAWLLQVSFVVQGGQ